MQYDYQHLLLNPEKLVNRWIFKCRIQKTLQLTSLSYHVDGVMLTGAQIVEDCYYEFDENGICENKNTINGIFLHNDKQYCAIADKLEDEFLHANGIIPSAFDGMFWIVTGTFVYGSLILIDGDYYYARTSDQLIVGKTYWITKANDMLSTANYQSDDPVRSCKYGRPFRRKIDRLFFSELGGLFFSISSAKCVSSM